MEMFRDASGPLYQFMKEIGREMTDCGKETPLEIFLRNLHVSRGDPSTSLGMTTLWIIAHLNELTETDFHLLSKIPRKFSVVHCPRSHAYFGHTRFRFERLQQLGFNICLGTDSLASNDDLSLFSEMRTFHKKFAGMTPQKTLEMVTVDAARALGREHELGKIAKNFLADMIALPVIENGDSFERILNFEGGVAWMMLEGKVIPTP
jgi:aminodeoxyfutalosine deaminase